MRFAKSIAVTAAAFFAFAAHAQTASTGSGQAYPAKPVRIIVLFAQRRRGLAQVVPDGVLGRERLSLARRHDL